MAFSKVAPRASLHVAKITLHFPKLQGEIGSQWSPAWFFKISHFDRFCFLFLQKIPSSWMQGNFAARF
jgi:hypothetical protein